MGQIKSRGTELDTTEKKYFYEKSNILNFKSNITFHELLSYDDKKLNEWIELLCSEVLEQWDQEGIPPTIGKNLSQIKEQMCQVVKYDTTNLLIKHEGDYIIRNKWKTGTCINQFFPTMMKTKISTNLSGEKGKSIYDFFSDPKLKSSFKKSMVRGVRKDGMYGYSVSLQKTDTNLSGIDFIRQFDFTKKGLWICENKTKNINNGLVSLSPMEIRLLISEGILKKHNVSNIDLINLPTGYNTKKGSSFDIQYTIRIYDKETKVFPSALQVFRMGLTQVVVNFNPITAKTLFNHFTNHIKRENKITIYDPSCGWGGRILGSLSMDRPTHYVGTDPNEELFIDEIGKTRYEYFGECFNKWTKQTNTYEIFRSGSEMIGTDKNFQKYFNSCDLVFTSPPYFNREQYTQSSTQSFKKFNSPKSWVDGFLEPTLKNCVKCLKPNRYLLWNISNIRIGKNVIDLEGETLRICKELGLEYRGMIKMLMTSMKGLKTENLENSIYFEGKHHKYEPIFVFLKK